MESVGGALAPGGGHTCPLRLKLGTGEAACARGVLMLQLPGIDIEREREREIEGLR